MASDVERVAEILGEPGVRTQQDLRVAVEKGLPLRAFERAARYIFGAGGEKDAFGTVLPRTTYLRRKKAGGRARLTTEESERTERLARISALAEHVFEDANLAREFLTSAQPNLGDRRPVDLVKTDLGAREVETLLYGLEFSLPI